MHVLFDESNSLNKKDAQDEDFKLGLIRKDLLFMHEKGKCSEEGSGPVTVLSEDGQSLNQSGGSTAEPCLEQNQSNFLRTSSETGPKSGLRRNSETGSRTGLGADTLGDTAM